MSPLPQVLVVRPDCMWCCLWDAAGRGGGTSVSCSPTRCAGAGRGFGSHGGVHFTPWGGKAGRGGAWLRAKKVHCLEGAPGESARIARATAARAVRCQCKAMQCGTGLPHAVRPPLRLKQPQAVGYELRGLWDLVARRHRSAPAPLRAPRRDVPPWPP